MLPPVNPLTARQRHLLKLFSRLSEDDQKTLAAFAEFLAAREARGERPAADVEAVDAPRNIPRPQQESVIAALKRLSSSYFMLDKAEMLDQTSALMTEHIMQGRPAEEVIDQLEVIFARHYSRLEARNRD